MIRRTFALAALMALAVAAPAAAITVDGTLDSFYGGSLHDQTTQTNFGNATDGQPGFTNGSELDALYAVKQPGTLYLFLAGNLQSNFNKVDIFIDVIGGGQNKLRGDNPNVDFNGLNRMGDDGGGNGLQFDAGFEADYWLSLTGGDSGGYKIFVNYSELLTGGGGTGYYVGEGTAASSGALTGGNNPHGILATIDNSNVAGVDGGCDASSGAGVAKGIELAIPMSALGGAHPGLKEFKICAFVNGGGHDFVSNQVLGSLPTGTCNLGEPRAVNFSAIAGNQYVTLATDNVPAASPWLLLVLSLGLSAVAVVTMRRRAVATA